MLTSILLRSYFLLLLYEKWGQSVTRNTVVNNEKFENFKKKQNEIWENYKKSMRAQKIRILMSLMHIRMHLHKQTHTHTHDSYRYRQLHKDYPT